MAHLGSSLLKMIAIIKQTDVVEESTGFTWNELIISRPSLGEFEAKKKLSRQIMKAPIS